MTGGGWSLVSEMELCNDEEGNEGFVCALCIEEYFDDFGWLDDPRGSRMKTAIARFFQD